MTPDVSAGATESELYSVAEKFGIEFGRTRYDLDIAGSPERSEFRVVIEDTGGRLLVAESVFHESLGRKKEIAGILAALSEAGQGCVNPNIRAQNGGFTAFAEGRFWILSPYIEGIPLDRPAYAFEKKLAKPLAGFLHAMMQTTESLPAFCRKDDFSIVRYIKKLEREIHDNDPAVYPEIRPFILYLEKELFDIHDSIPVRFCHGDYHPLNIIWNRDKISAVIDWEFCGLRPESYDIANLTGCLGMENPDSLKGPLITCLIRQLCERDYLSEAGRHSLTPMIIALRFAWLAEWLRRRDSEMIRLELTYLDILAGNDRFLKKIWGLS